MSLKLNSSGGGSVTLQEPTTASNVTLNLPAADGTVVYENASGNVGIGTSSPAYKFDVNGIIRGRSDQYFGWVSGSQAGVWWSQTNYAVPAFQGLTSAGNVGDIVMQPGGGNLLIGASSFTANTVAFSQGSLYVNESVFVGNSGGTAARSVRLDGFQDEIYVAWSNGNTDNNTIKYAYGGTAWVNSSDETLKDIIEPISDAANKVCTLRAVIGKFKNEEEGARHPFLIAQDVQAVLPEAVYVNKSRVEGEPDTLGVGYTDTIPLLVAAIKEQQAMIEELKAKVAALEAQ